MKPKPQTRTSDNTSPPDNAGNCPYQDINNGPYQGVDNHYTYGKPQNYQTRLSSKNSIKICQLNVEGLSSAKREIITKLCQEHNIDILNLQETHVSDCQSQRLHIAGMELIHYVGHDKFGLATYVKPKLKPQTRIIHTNSISISIGLKDLTIVNVYKPPSIPWQDNILETHRHPAIYTGDFNSQHTEWGYRNNDSQGNKLAEWSSINDLHLVYDSKQGGSFHSARWKSTTNPDLCFVTIDQQGNPLPTNQLYLPKFPRSQHSPIITEIGISFPSIESAQIPRWNIRKANWEKYTDHVEHYIRRIPPNIKQYKRFIGLLKSAAKLAIPRGYRKSYIPCWTKKCNKLWEKHQSSNNFEEAQKIAEDLVHTLNEERRNRWNKTLSEMDFTASSRKSWTLLRKLGSADMPAKPKSNIKPDQIANVIFKRSNIKVNKYRKRAVKEEYRRLLTTIPEASNFVTPVIPTDIDSAINNTKKGKAAGPDDILPEFIIFLGPKARIWLASFFTNILKEGKIPDLWKQSHIIAIPKPGKDVNNPEDYRPISLLCTTYKLFERVLLSRINPTIDKCLPPEQAGFRNKRSCDEQVLALTTFIEKGFQSKSKTGAVFLDLTAAYDTVWKNGLLLKAAKIIKCKSTLKILNNLLSDRRYYVSLNGSRSKFRVVQNGLPQGSVLAPVLFNLYTSDIPSTTARKFIYADDIALATQATTFDELDRELNSDLSILETYFKEWYLQPNPNKTVSTTFHLSNIHATRSLKLKMCGNPLPTEGAPKYLGVKLDRSLTFRDHIEATRGKIRTRNNLIGKLAGSTWGCDANTLRTSAIALVYSVAEYCAPVWNQSAHTAKLDIELNNCLRKVTGLIKSTPTEWLPVLANIEPADLRRKKRSHHLWQRIEENECLPIHQDLKSLPSSRLKSRNPPWQKPDTTSISETWQERWQNTNMENHHLIVNPCEKPLGFSLPRKLWVKINRIRTCHGRSKHSLHKWGYIDSPNCDCGAVQTIPHIVNDCPLYAYPTGINGIATLDEEAIAWLEDLRVTI